MKEMLDKNEQRIEDNAYAYIPSSSKEEEYIETLLDNSKKETTYKIPQKQFMEARDSSTVSWKTESALATLKVTVLNKEAMTILKALEDLRLIRIISH